MSEFKLKKARVDHYCSKCNKLIRKGDRYYCEDKFLGSLHKPLKKYCIDCFQKVEELIKK